MRVSEQDSVGVFLDVIASEVLGNVSLKLSDLADSNRLAVTPLRFSEHPLPVNHKDGIELGIANGNSLGLDAHELQPTNNSVLERPALLKEQALQDAYVFKRCLQLLLLTPSAQLCGLGLKQGLSQSALSASLITSDLGPIWWGIGRSSNQLLMNLQKVSNQVNAVHSECCVIRILEVDGWEKHKMPTSLVLNECTHDLIRVVCRKQWNKPLFWGKADLVP